MNEILYLNASHLDSLDPGPTRIVDILEEVFRYKARGQTQMPPKIFFQPAGDRFYSAMASCCPPLGFAGGKWQSGDPKNPARGLPYVQGLYVLNEHETGCMVAVMDAKWITGMRTAAASANAARWWKLAKTSSRSHVPRSPSWTWLATSIAAVRVSMWPLSAATALCVAPCVGGVTML